MLKIFRWLGQLSILSSIYWVGTQLSEKAALPIPGSVLGVVLLFALLSLNIIKLEHVQDVADYLLKHLTFFFVPVAVGLMTAADIFINNSLVLTLAIVIGAAIPFWVVGTITQKLRRRRGECNI